jgi:ABC-type branched-subunit amino acid transport system substrate-binding protein
MRRAFAAAFILIAISIRAAPKLSEQQARGKQIYLHGESRGGKPITALMGGEGVEVPATIVPCTSCHGADARGRDEAGVRPSNLRWDVLTSRHDIPGERSHPPYTRAAIKRAITMGVDPAGHKLQPAMPRYRMSLTQIDDLIAYLQELPNDSDPGLTNDTVRLGVILPTGAHAASARSLVEAYAARLNHAGGIYGRKIELRFLAAQQATPNRATLSHLQEFIDGDQPFAIAASSLIGNEDEFESVIDRNQLPAIAAIATREPKSHYSFHLLAGIREQAVALAQYATKRGAKNPSIVFSDEQPWRDIAAEVMEETKIKPSASSDAIVVLGPASLQRRILEGRPQLVLIPGAIAAVDNVPTNRRAAIAVPLLPSDASPAGIAELRGLGDNSISPAVTGTFVSVQLLVEALRRAGRDLGREKLIDTLEGFYDMQSGLTPKIRFGPNRHTGTNVAHILVWDGKAFVPDDPHR